MFELGHQLMMVFLEAVEHFRGGLGSELLMVGHEIDSLALLPAPGRCEQATTTALSYSHLLAFPGLYFLKQQARRKPFSFKRPDTR